MVAQSVSIARLILDRLQIINILHNINVKMATLNCHNLHFSIPEEKYLNSDGPEALLQGRHCLGWNVGWLPTLLKLVFIIHSVTRFCFGVVTIAGVNFFKEVHRRKLCQG